MKRASPATMVEAPGVAVPRRKKKTRELPNLSDCHGCTRRINYRNPKNRLRTLTSEWRIVLLCKSCHSLVESSKYCSYCLTGVSSSSMYSFYECKTCRRRIHRSCFSRFDFGDPGNCGEFSVCFDCWVPELLENEYGRVHGDRTTREAKVCVDSNPIWVSRGCDAECKAKLVEKMVNAANVVVQKNIAVAVEDKEDAITKAVVVRRAVDKGGEGGGSVIDEDAQLAIKLHRVMNSSPRTARNPYVSNTNCVNVTKFNTDANFDASQPQAVIETSGFSKPTIVAGDVTSVDTDLLKRELNGCLTETKPDCLQKSSGAEDKKCSGHSNGFSITYSRRGSQDGRCKEPDCFCEDVY